MDPKKFVEREASRPEHDPEKRKRRKSLKASRKQEERLAKKLGGHTQSGSGTAKSPIRPGREIVRQRSSHVKTRGRGDVEAGSLKVEAKSTSKKSISIKRSWLEKVYLDATLSNQDPAFAITFTERSDVPGFPQDWTAVPTEWLRAVMEKAGIVDPDGDSA